ncbi:MAG: LysR family transcriptional regulator, partial [Myxococcota bacterium]
MPVDFRTPQLDWDDARYFLAAYRARSLSGAARALGVSHSTIRRRLSGLEETLDVRLFTATAEGLIPTDAARAAYAQAEDVEHAVGRFGDRLVGASRELSG